MFLTRGRSYSPDWDTRNYSITYENLPNDTKTEGWPTTYAIENDTIDLPRPTRAGYQLKGWSISGVNNVDSSTKTDLVEKLPKGTYGNATCTAVWDTIETKEFYLRTPADTTTKLVMEGNSWIPHGKVNETTISFLTGGTYEGKYFARVEPPRPGASDHGYYCYVELIGTDGKTTRLEFSRSGYKSVGVAVGSLAIIAPAELPLVRATWVTPSWEPISYPISYSGLSEGTDANSWRTTYTIEDEAFDLPLPTTPVGYAFDGWTWDATASPHVQITGALAQQVEKGSYGDLVLTPSWHGSSAPRRTQTEVCWRNRCERATHGERLRPSSLNTPSPLGIPGDTPKPTSPTSKWTTGKRLPA